MTIFADKSSDIKILIITDKLYGYTLTYDDGFAPNPFFGVLTLATCKPRIRNSNQMNIGMWIAAWAGKRIQGHNSSRELVYLARVTDIMTLGEYWCSIEFQCKKPLMLTLKSSKHTKGCGTKTSKQSDDAIHGDNIYMPADISCPATSELIQQPNFHHGPNEVKRDISGRNVLICREFYYFGGQGNKNHLEIPQTIQISKPGIGQKIYPDADGSLVVSELINFVIQNADKATLTHLTK